MRLRCFYCGKSVSTEVPDGTIVRASLECPECIERESTSREYPNRKPALPNPEAENVIEKGWPLPPDWLIWVGAAIIIFVLILVLFEKWIG